MTVTVRAPLGVAVSVVVAGMRATEAFYDDPITRESGCADELGPAVDRHERDGAVKALALLGWTPDELCRVLRERVSAKWVYEWGIEAWLDTGILVPWSSPTVQAGPFTGLRGPRPAKINQPQTEEGD
jgi:hypothetical protein